MLRSVPLLMFAVACAGPSNPPSLSPRAIEKSTFVQERAAPPVRPVEAVLAASIEGVLTRARNGDAAFRQALSIHRSVLFAGALAGSEAWLATQQARSSLEAARQPAADALAEIDALRVENAAAIADDSRLGGSTEIAAAQAEIAAIVEHETASLTR